jgi:alcohol dehydrogenase, propanol-preferring
MRAMVLSETASIDSSPLALREVPDPNPGLGEVRVRVRCCALCRTDLHVIEGDLPPHKRPIIPGHQIVGIVDAIGPACRRLRMGQRVGIAWLRETCGQCEYCRSGRENLCPNAAFTGYDADGGYAQYAVVREDFAYEIPPEFDDADAAPLLCAGIVGYRSLKRANPRPGCKICLIGFGSSAHVVMQIAQNRNCEVFVATRGSNHRELARSMGAHWVGEHPSELPAPVDSAILFAPVGALVPPMLEKLKPGGTLSLAGIHMTDIPAMQYERHLFHERDIHSVTCNTRDDGHELLAEAARIPIRPHIKRYALANLNQALQDVKADRIEGTGVVMID